MSELNYKPNSYKSKEEQTESAEKTKRVEKVVTGTVKTKKKSELAKLSDIFIPGDIKNVKSYIFSDVLVPAIVDAVEDIVTKGIRMLLRGDAGSRDRRSTADRVSYVKYYDRKDDSRRADTSRTRTGYNYDDIILQTRGEAEEVLSRMDEIIDTYGVVSVSDLYDLVGVTGNYTDNKYGWTNIRNAKPIRVRDGYMLDLPKVLPIN